MRIVSQVMLVLLCATGLSAQSFYGSLRGRVMDQSGSVIPGATITLSDEATGLKRSTVSGASGDFAFASLNPATYTVVAETPGFKLLERAGVVVSTQSAVSIDLKMEIGAVTEQIFVTEEVPLLETANASTGTVVDRQKLLDLPNLGRNAFMMSKLSESIVQTGNPKFNRMQDQSGSSSISIAGGPVRGNNYTLDGVAITDSSNRAVIIPSLEAVEEVKVQANTYDAEMGRTGGGTFNTTLRSGTNKLNFSAFGYIRETEMLANNFFANKNGTPIIDQPFRNYGGSIGGPIIIPKVYDGRNKTFFWISGEAYRQTESASSLLEVPTALERVGDFSQTLNPAGNLNLIYDPLTTTTAGVRTPFANNIIPEARRDPAGLALASYYPLPNTDARYYADSNFNASVGAFNRADQTTWKLDQEITTWWKMNMSYLHYGSQEPGNQWFQNVATPGQSVLYRKVDATQVNATLTPTPTMVVAIRYGFNRFPNFSAPTSLGFDLSSLNLPSSYTSLVSTSGFPVVTMGNLENYGGRATINQSVLHSKSWNTTVSKFMGKHSLKVGFDYRQINNDQQPTSGPGSFEFSNVFTREDPTLSDANSGADVATMVLGYPTGGSLTVGESFFNFVRYTGFFVQDDYRVNTNLTLNFGMRYEYETAPQERDDHFIIGFDTDALSPLSNNVGFDVYGTPLYAGVDGNGTQSGNPRNKWGPRFGFAYSANQKTVFRGGYGIFWAPQNFSAQSAIGYSQSTPIVTSFDNNFTPAASLRNPYPDGLLPIVGNAARGLAGIGQDIRLPDMNARSGGYVQQYSFDIQRQLPTGFGLSLGYIGSTSRDLHIGRDLNQVHPNYFSLGASALNASVANPFYQNGGILDIGGPTVSQSQLLKPFPQYSRVRLDDADFGQARYHSVYLKLQRRMAQGLTTQATYTWSQKTELEDGTSWQNIYDGSREYGISDEHSPHRFSLAATYELPFGQGKQWLSGGNGVADALFGGWSINVVTVLQSGYPLGITQSNSNSVIAARAQRPNATGETPVVEGPIGDRLTGYLNRDAFSVAPQFTFGNLPYNISLRGPGWLNMDASVFKTFSIGERLRAQFRGEALNLTNTPYFANPATNITSGSFGNITSQRNFSRLIQLGVRFYM